MSRFGGGPETVARAIEKAITKREAEDALPGHRVGPRGARPAATHDRPDVGPGHDHAVSEAGRLMDRLSSIDASFLAQEREGSHMHIGGVMIFEGPPPSGDELQHHIHGAAAPGAALPAEARLPALRDGPAAVDRRPALQHRLPRASDRAAGAGHPRAAAAAGCADLLPATRPLQAAVGDLARRGPRGRPLRAHQQDPSLPGRRRLRRGPHGCALRPRPGAGGEALAAGGVGARPGAVGGGDRGRGRARPGEGAARARRRRRGRAPAARRGSRPRPRGGGGPGRGGLGDREQPAEDAAQREARTAPADPLAAHAARRPQGDQERPRRDGQRRLPRARHRGATALAASAGASAPRGSSCAAACRCRCGARTTTVVSATRSR